MTDQTRDVIYGCFQLMKLSQEQFVISGKYLEGILLEITNERKRTGKYENFLLVTLSHAYIFDLNFLFF